MRKCPVKVYLLILAVWVIHLVPSIAQQFPHGLPEIKNFTSKDYQWHPKNFQIIQGANGLIYVGNSYGILEYDGKMWRQISLPNGLDGHSLNVAKDGQVLVGTNGEFGILSHESIGTTYYQSLSSELDLSAQSLGEISGIWSIQDGLILASDHSIYLFQSGELNPIVEDNGEICCVEVIKNKVYYQSEHDIVVFDLQKFQTEKRHPLKIKMANIISSAGQLLTISPKGIIYDPIKGEMVKSLPLPADFTVHKAHALKSGMMVLASHNKGLVILDADLNLLHHIDSHHGLLSDNIFDVSEDKEGNLWIALDNGISHLTLNTPFTHYGLVSGVRGMGYSSAIFNDKLFMGTSQGVFTHNDQGEFELVPGSEGQINELHIIGSQLFVAHESGLFLMEGEQMKRISGKEKVWGVRRIPNRENLLLVGTEQGIYLIDHEGGRLKFSKKLGEFTESSRVMAFDTDNQLWICHGNKGLFRLDIDFDKRKIKSIEFYAQDEGNLPVYISFVSPSKNGLLFSSENGVYQFDPSSKTFHPHEQINAFLDENHYVDKIVEGTFKSLWILQEDKITKLDPLDNGSYTLLPENIITELNGNLVGSYEHLHVYDSNNVVIGTQEGFAHFNVNANINYRLNSRNNLSKTIIREVRFESPDSSFLAKTEMDAPMQLDHSFNSITFTYAPGYYQSRDQIKFSFYLEALDKKAEFIWSEWHASNQNSFKNLAPGRYRFHVRSRGDLFKNSEPVSYPFIIQSPWYATRLSGIIYTFCLILIGIAIYKVRVAKIKEEKKQALLQKDEELIQQKLIADSEKVKLINERLKEKVLLKNKELGSVALEITKKNEFLGQLKKNLAQLSSSASGDAMQKLRRAIRSIDQNMRSDNNWERFELYFDESHQYFIKKLKEKQPGLTKSSINLCAFLKLDLSTKEIASLMNISVSGVEKRRHRLRKKLNLATDTNLKEYLEAI